MKKIALISIICLIGLSSQAMQNDWRNEENRDRATQLARDYFFSAHVDDASYIIRQDIRDAMQKFPEFLSWKFNDEGVTITHLLCKYYAPNTLRYLLGFSPDLASCASGHRPCSAVAQYDYEALLIFEEYEINPWRHPNNVFSLPVDHDQYIYDGKKFGEEHPFDCVGSSSGQVRQDSEDATLGNNLLGIKGIKSFVGLGAMVILALVYRYKVSEDKDQAAV